MVALVTVSEMREHVETDLSNYALQIVIDAADQDIVLAAGEHSSTGTVSRMYLGGYKGLILDRPYASITSITEHTGTTNTVLTTNDWQSWYGNRVLHRLSQGADNPADNWAERVTIVATPVNDDNLRKQVTIDLVRLALAYNALQSERAGDYSKVSADHAKERALILARLNRNSMMPV